MIMLYIASDYCQSIETKTYPPSGICKYEHYLKVFISPYDNIATGIIGIVLADLNCFKCECKVRHRFSCCRFWL